MAELIIECEWKRDVNGFARKKVVRHVELLDKPSHGRNVGWKYILTGEAMAKQRILVVEDEEDILELVRYNLRKAGYTVEGVSSGEEALQKIGSFYPDLIILDLMLPGLDGLSVCRHLKNDRQTQQIPVVMLTAKSEENDIVGGLEVGADDYIAKPFSPRVLIARVQAVLRRSEPDENAAITLSALTIHPGRHEVQVNGQPVVLTNTEFKVLHLLATRPGWVFSRSQIVERLHEHEFAVTERSVDVQIVGIRKKLGPAGDCIKTVRGVGYRLSEE
jgi:two-component system phosphate regulon response regulator PhoB